VLAITFLLTIVFISGCVSNGNPLPSSVPAVTVGPTAQPTPTPVPTPVVRQESADVYILGVGDSGIYQFNFSKGLDSQTESFTTEVANDGNTSANNVTLTLTETDAQGGNMIIQQNFPIGNIPRSGRQVCTLTTNPHAVANSVYITITIEWGAYNEFYNPTTFIDQARTTWG
jgi:hypothetical protein